jgi:arylamine N-acetyltransferase
MPTDGADERPRKAENQRAAARFRAQFGACTNAAYPPGCSRKAFEFPIPHSHFVTGLTAARAPGRRRLTLRNRQLTEHTTGGATTKRTIASAAEIREGLENEFLIRLPSHFAPSEKLASLPP